MPRPLRPRATDAIVVAPIAITDRTCAPLTGLDPRPWRELVERLRIPHVRAGKRISVLVADYVAAIERASRETAREHSDDATDQTTEEHTPTAVALLARLGRTRAA